MTETNLEKLLNEVRDGTVSINEAMAKIQAYQDIGFAKLDHERQKRTGFPEVIYGQGKTVDQLIKIIEALAKEDRLLVTKVDSDKSALLCRQFPHLKYNERAMTLSYVSPTVQDLLFEGYIAVVSAGTSDMSVAEEAAVTAETFGCEVKRIYDVGVAGIHRLFNQLETIRGATVSVVVAGMEGALASVLGGLVDHPVIAVPTSVGYGANFQGLSALLSMLNACSPGISVVNIDNGFGAGYYASLIERNQTKRGHYT